MKEAIEYNQHYLKYRKTILQNAKDYQNKKTKEKRIITETKKVTDELKIRLFDIMMMTKQN